MNIFERTYLRRCISETLSAIRNVGDNTEVRDKLVHHLDHLLHAERLSFVEFVKLDACETDTAGKMRTTFKDTEPDWIEWRGGDCPVPDGSDCEVRFRDGVVLRADDPHDWDWKHMGRIGDIVAYRVLSK